MRACQFCSMAAAFACVACGGNDDGERDPRMTLSGGGDDDGSGHGEAPPAMLGPLVRICPMGDSITAGTGETASYRRPLWKSLLALGANVDFVGSMDDNNTGPPPFDDYDWDNEGHGGYRADQLADRLPEWIVTYPTPDIVLLHIGTNDLLQGDKADDVLADIDRLLAVMRGKNPRVIVIMARIIGMTTQQFTDKARSLNEAMPAFVASRATSASPLYLVDQMAGFSPATMTDDGTHPNEAGERAMAEVWLARLRPLLSLE